ncbi:hypothetical protein RB595_010379 [Gaeumannomyces hyphopodioides]
MKRRIPLAVFRAKLQVDYARSAMAEPSSGNAAGEQVSEAHMETADKAADTVQFTKLDPSHFSNRRPAGGPRALSDLLAAQSELEKRMLEALSWLHEDDDGDSRSVLGIKVRMLWQRSMNSDVSSSETGAAAAQKTAARRCGDDDGKMMDIPHREAMPQHRRTSSTGSGGHIRSLLDQCPAEAFARLCREEAPAAVGQDDEHRKPGWECCNCHVALSEMEWTCWHCKVHARCGDCKR